MNRRMRREMARAATKQAGMKGREKSLAAARIARELPGGSDHIAPDAAPRLEEPRKRSLTRTQSGLIVPENDG